jgi:hypothetical protein
VKKAVEKSTLDQPGTRPFHLKAAYAPSFERNKHSYREGEVEIWWESPTRWHREVRSPDFHQIDPARHIPDRGALRVRTSLHAAFGES